MKPVVYHIKTQKAEFDLKLNGENLEFLTTSLTGLIKTTNSICIDKNNSFHAKSLKEIDTDGRVEYTFSSQQAKINYQGKDIKVDLPASMTDDKHTEVAKAIKKEIGKLVMDGISNDDAKQIASLKILIEDSLKENFSNDRTNFLLKTATHNKKHLER